MTPFGDFQMSAAELSDFRSACKMFVEWYAKQIALNGYEVAIAYGSYIHILSRMLVWSEDDIFEGD